MRKPGPPSELHLSILRTLCQFKALDTPTLRNVCAPEGMTEARFYKQLDLLKKRAFIKVSSRPGMTSVIYPTPAGAWQIGQELTNTHYNRPISPVTLKYRQARIVIEKAAEQLGLIVYPMIPPTKGDKKTLQERPGYKAMLADYRFLEVTRLNTITDAAEKRMRELDLVANVYKGMPKDFRDYYIQRPGYTGIVMVLPRSFPPPNRDYWEKKKEQYKSLVDYIPVYFAFDEMPPRTLIDNLKKAGLRLFLLSAIRKTLDEETLLRTVKKTWES